jgi:hypothetical protein
MRNWNYGHQIHQRTDDCHANERCGNLQWFAFCPEYHSNLEGIVKIDSFGCKSSMRLLHCEFHDYNLPDVG